MPATLFGQDGQDLEPTADILVTRPDWDPKSFVYSAVVLLVAASIAVAAFRHFGLGSVLGLLVAGIFIGPHTPGPSAISHVEDVRHHTELGVVVLLFLIGLEMHARHVVVIVVIKILVLLALCLLFREGCNAALRVALLLAQRGEFGFVLFGAAKALAIIDSDTFVLAIGVISLTMLVTPLLDIMD